MSIGTSLAVVLSRRLIINLILVFIILVYGIYWINTTDVSQGVPIDTSWETFLDECGAKNFNSTTIAVNESIRNKWRVCEMKYIGRTFQNWKGHVIRVEDNRAQGISFFKAISILVKMEPEEFKERTDLVLNVNYEKVSNFKDRIDEIEHGSEIVFNATLKSLMLTRANFMHIVSHII